MPSRRAKWLSANLASRDPLLVDDAMARDSRDPSAVDAVGTLYRDIRRSFERDRAFVLADRFAVLELDSRRRALEYGAGSRAWGWLRSNLLSIEALYWHLTGYGQSVAKPLAWLALLILVSPLLFGGLGVTLNGASYGPVGWFVPAADAGYRDLLAFTLRSAALLNDLPGTQLDIGAQVLQLVVRLAAPLLAVSASLAVRRLLRR